MRKGILWFGLMLLTLRVSAQETDSLTFDQHYQQLFDTTQTKDVFLEHINAFIAAVESKGVDSTRHWHRGQTDYEEQIFGDSLQTFNSTTYFNNSMYSTLYVDQLVYRGKVIRRALEGGINVEPYAQGNVFSSDFVYTPTVPTDSVLNPDAPKKEQVFVPARQVLECTETYLNHDLGIKVVFRAKFSYFDLFEDSRTTFAGPIDFRKKFDAILSISFEPLTEEDHPYVYIENH